MKNIERQQRINEAEKFFNLLYGNVTERKFGYLWTKQDKATYPFAVSNPDERREMARKAIELSDAGADVYYGINLTDAPPTKDKRVIAENVTLQTATVTDIDIEGGTHISDDKKKYPPTFDAAKNLLPFDVSVLVDSGYGLHGLCIYAEPITITADNRKQAEERNKNFLNVIRSRAGAFSKVVDGVGDLPRVLRVPGTYNYKLGADNAPLCKLVAVTPTRFTPADMDSRLNALEPTKTKQQGATTKTSTIQLYSANKPSEQERALAMLLFVPVAAQTYEDWIAIGMILKNNGNYLADWEQWSRNDTRFKPGECESKWQTFKDNGGLTIATLHDFASKLYGYSERAYQRDWHLMHDSNPKTIQQAHDAEDFSALLAELKAQPQSKSRDAQIIAIIRNLCNWNYRKDESGQVVKSTIKSTFANIELILKNDPNLSGLFGNDRFQSSTVFLKKAPWHQDNHTGEQWHDTDDAELRNYIRKNYAELKEKQLIEDAAVHFANLNAFHPVKEYFQNLPKWDGIKRAEKLFIKFLRADDTPYTREVTLNWLTAAVARIFRPGCRYQTALVLQGGQGIGKSYIAERLGGAWYGAIVDNVDDPHAIDALQNIWIGEFKEMSAMRKVDVDNIKSFIERNADNRRGAYERHAKIKMRHCVFIVTVNDSEFLRDQTGNRRFLIIRCNSKMFDYVDGLTDEYISQLWAEVYQRYNEQFKDLNDVALGNKLELSRATKYEAEEIAKGYLQDDGLTTEIKSFLDKPLPPKIIWRLMNKDDRRKFFVDGQITFDHETLNYRRRAQGGREQDVEHDINEIYKLLNSKRTDIQQVFFGETTCYRFYGFELREHVCAAEIFNECFGTGDKRKAMYRINEILSKLDGWHLGDRLQKTDSEYRDQKKPYYRDADNRPKIEDTDSHLKNKDTNPADVQPADELQGKPLEPNDAPPFDSDDLPI